jgi:hypothetical protein
MTLGSSHRIEGYAVVQEKCQNCGGGIGELETPHVWNERIVCRSCHAKLQPKSWMRKWTILGCAIVAVGIATFLIVRSVVPSVRDAVPVNAQSNLTSDSAAQQLAKVAAENEMLRQQAVAEAAENEKIRQQIAALTAAPPPPVPAQAPPQSGRLTGSAWLTTNGGASNLMRGLNVAVLTPTIDSRPIVAMALAGIPNLQKEMDFDKSSIAEQKQLDANINESADTDELLKDHENDLAADQARIDRINRLASNPPPTLNLKQAYSFLKDGADTYENGANAIPNVPLVFAGNIVKSGKTNVDGKYIITDVAPGNYYIYALFGSSSMGVDWLVPIQINAGEETTVDLDNDNAATVRNNN